MGRVGRGVVRRTGTLARGSVTSPEKHIFFPSRPLVSLRPVMVDTKQGTSTAIYVIVGWKHNGVSKLKIYLFPVTNQ
jgi:hypothetical protein